MLTYTHQGGGAAATVLCVGNSVVNCGNSTYVPVGSSTGLVPRTAVIRRDGLSHYDWQTFNWYAQDTYTANRLTVSAGTRWDRQSSRLLGGCVSANSILPVALPQRCQDAMDVGAPFSAFAPRLAATYDVTGDGRMAVHASFAYYRASKVTLATLFNRLAGVGLTYGSNQNSGACSTAANSSCWTDANHDGVVQANELTGTPTPSNSLLLADDFIGLNEFPIIDPHLQSARTREGTVGLDRELGGALHAAVDFVYRYNDLGSATYTVPFGIDNGPDAVQFVINQSALWQRHIQVDPATGVTAPYYTCSNCQVGTTSIITTSLAYSTYRGVVLSLARRLSDRWQGNVSYTWSDERSYTPVGSFSTTGTAGNPTGIEFSNGFTNGAPPHDLKGFASFRLPYALTVGVNASVHSGTVRQLVIAGPNASGALAFQDAGTTWSPVVSQVDLNVARAFRLGRTQLTLTADCFNLLNAATALTYVSNVLANNGLEGSPAFNIATIMPPRVFRLDARISF